MYIGIHAPGMPFNGDTIKAGESLGGSETAAYYMAKELAALGHQVVIFTNHQKTGRWDGVKYEWLGKCTKEAPLGDRFHYVMQTPYDVCIVQRHPAAFLYQYNSKLNIWWLHDLALHRYNSQVQRQFINVDKIFTVSEFHKEQVSKVYDIKPEHIFATQNGIDYSFKAFNSENQNRIPRSLFFAARPERGLANLVDKGGIMETLTDCHLYIAGYANTTAQMRGFYEYLFDRCDKLPNVTNLGPLGKDALYNYMRSMMLYVYPTDFKDTSCIVALEAQACGLPFVGPRIAALPETLRDGGANLLPSGHDNKVNKKKFIKSINGLLNNDSAWRSLHKKCKNIHQPWADIAKKWSDLFAEELEKKSLSDKKRLFAHFEQNSDIVAMQKAGATPENYPSLTKNYSFLLNNDFNGHYKRYYEYEKNRGVIYGPEDLTNNPRFMCTCDIIKELKPKTILDYGCAHGHYVMNLAKKFPDIKFVGVDLEQSNVDKARKWAIDEGLTDRCKFFCYNVNENSPKIEHGFVQVDFKEMIELPFDLILAQEVLEHVADPRDVIIKLSKYLADHGTFMVDVPYGPWEAIGYEDHKGWRAHIHMLERADLLELFGKQKDYKIMALPHRVRLGHYLCYFGRNGNPIGEIDYDRKIRQQSPQQTLSVCIIAKDAEFTLGKTLRSVSGIANEIIVGIDETTTDETKKVAEKFGAITFPVPSPIKEIGFAAARNLTIEKATCDWILWIDADETFEQSKDLSIVLRDNPYDGYAIKQHHYAIEPAKLFRTDLPVRLFRNHKGQKFYGWVHEHPELEYNKGPGKIILLGDCAIMHIGYPTENIRRKRFDRNFPLMIKDREINPDRILGCFLWARDLAHFIKYILEENGGVRTEEVIARAEEIIETWRGLVKNNHQRMVVEGLQYYSEAVKILGNGINYTISLDSCPLGRDLHIPKDVSGTFVDTKDIRNLTEMLLKNNISIYDEAYY